MLIHGHCKHIGAVGLHLFVVDPVLVFFKLLFQRLMVRLRFATERAKQDLYLFLFDIFQAKKSRIDCQLKVFSSLIKLVGLILKAANIIIANACSLMVWRRLSGEHDTCLSQVYDCKCILFIHKVIILELLCLD